MSIQSDPVDLMEALKASISRVRQARAAAERNVPRNPRPLCEDFAPQPAPSEFWCSTCRWNRPMHDMPEHRTAIAAVLAWLDSAPNLNESGDGR